MATHANKLPANFPYPPAAHGPVQYGHRLVGCSCGFEPSHPTAAFENVFTSYKRHRQAAAGSPNDYALQPVRWGYGENIGKPVNKFQNAD